MTDNAPLEVDDALTPVPTFAGRRLQLIRALLAVSWISLAGLAYQIQDADAWTKSRVIYPAIGAGLLIAALSAARWTNVRRLGANALLVGWGVAISAGLVASSVVRGAPLSVSFAAVALLGALLAAGSVAIGLFAFSAVGGYFVAAWAVEVDFSEPIVWIEGGVLAGLGVLALAVAWSVDRHARFSERQAREFRAQQEELHRRQRNLEQVYDVSRTMGAGQNLAEVLPELVGRVANSVGANVGLVALYRKDEQALEVMSPIWVAGQALRAEGYMLPLTESGLAQKVFVGGEGSFVNELASSSRDQLLIDLDATRVAAVPLQIEGHAMGVLLVTDKEDEITAEDLSVLESLAAPAALILEHLTRYEEVQQTSVQMAEVARLKTDFVSVVSHELRTPLTSIIGSLATLARPQLAPTEPGAQELLNSARRQADRLKRLIEDLLTVSRLDNRSMPLRPESIELYSYIREVVNLVPQAAAVVTLDLAPELPAVETDPEHLRRIVTNLIENALKYAQGSPVECICRVAGREVWISVVDHGPGIPYELNDHIFNRFTQAGPHETRAATGTGLGLSIVRGLAETMGGRVWYEPTVGGGATFTVSLPITAPVIRLPTAESA
ncbi:MAG: ATP-binding protein [Acidimicrobiia bacterium]|nr:ATP-binding protein [Acidimicrobiia bacterium]